MKIDDNINIYNKDCIELMSTLADKSIDVICIDPPYLYLKNQKLERPFDELLFFSEAKRLLTKNGFIILFGRGASFYRWNTILADLGFIFKEEIIWDKSYCSSPLMAVSRVHETTSIWTKENGTINKVKVPYTEMKSHDIDSVIQDVKRLKSVFKNTKSLDAVIEFLQNNNLINTDKGCLSTSVSSIINKADRQVSTIKTIRDGANEKTIIRTDYNRDSVTHINATKSKIKDGEKEVNIVQSIGAGMNEKTIIKQIRDHYSAIHPTQKPVRLLERLLALVIPQDKPREEIVIADFFGGSFSTMEAVYNMGMHGIACEIDKEYFELGKERLEKLSPVQKELFQVA